jgi:TetR/AcrR family transcriptional repressor of mexJK operon
MSTVPNPKRQAILDAAKRVFLAHGYSGASMEAIAEAAPVSKPTLYSHFKGKQDLFAAVIAGECESLLRTLARVQTKPEDPMAGLKAIASAFVDLVYANEALSLYRLIIAEQQHFPELGALVYRSGPELVLRLLSSYLGELDARGILRIPHMDTSSQLFLGMLQGCKYSHCLIGLQPGLSDTEKEDLIDSTVSLFLKGHGYDT